MKKILVLIGLAVLLLPVIVRVLPESMSVERVRQAFEGAGYEVHGLETVESPERDAAEQWRFRIDDYRIDLYRYANEGKIAKNHGYLKPDVGSAIVESMNLAQQLGAAPSKNLPTAVQRKGMWLFHVRGEDKARCRALADLFKKS